LRPLQLELEGFMGWRRRHVLDLEGLDLFAFVGPTGAGKSSLIEAMTFALYGVAPRLDDRRQVAPVISQGALEARVRLDFVVGATRHTAVRVVRRTGERTATTREARLERDGQVLAGDPDGVTRAVEEALGLQFDHFVRCVVLPQGEFARLLHDAPRDRDALLRELLGTGLYERVRTRAYSLGERLRAEVEVLDAKLESLWEVPELLKKAEERLRVLEELESVVAMEARALTELDEQVRRTKDEAEAAGQRAARLKAIRAPSEVAELRRQLEEAEAALAKARRAEAEAQDRVRSLRDRIGGLPARAELKARIDALEELARRRADWVRAEVELASQERERSAAEATWRTARERLERAEAVVAEAEGARREAHERLNSLPTEDAIRSGIEALAEVDWRRRAVADARQVAEKAEADVRKAEERHRVAQARVDEARAELEHLRLVHAAVELAGKLARGDPCPVCGRPLEGPVTQPHAGDVAEAQEKLEAAEAAWGDSQGFLQAAREAFAQAQASLRLAEDELARVEAKAAGVRPAEELRGLLEQMKATRELAVEAERHEAEARKALGDREREMRRAEEQLAGVRERVSASAAKLEVVRQQLAEAELSLAHLPSEDELRRQLEEVERLEAALKNTESVAQDSIQVRTAAEGTLQQIQDRERAAWREFHRARDSVSDCGPPTVEGQLHEAWGRLATWAVARASEEEKAAEEALQRAQELEAERNRRREALVRRIAEAQIPVDPGEDLAVATARTAGSVRAEVNHLRMKAEEANRLQEQQKKLETQRQVAVAVERELRSDRFPRWVLEEALVELVEGATKWLRDLSRGRYSLDLDRETKEVRFVVVDHSNADQRRSVRTLSGGETFLASLSLALALGSHLASLAARSGTLETLFLDEGFGTLDPESLDVVAGALEELAAGDRLVGVVTHVREVAERVPVRFEVRPGPDGPTLERVES
jgi:exonuclease SbcC